MEQAFAECSNGQVEAHYLTWEALHNHHYDYYDDGNATLSDRNMHFPSTPLCQEVLVQLYGELDQEHMTLQGGEVEMTTL